MLDYSKNVIVSLLGWISIVANIKDALIIQFSQLFASKRHHRFSLFVQFAENVATFGLFINGEQHDAIVTFESLRMESHDVILQAEDFAVEL